MKQTATHTIKQHFNLEEKFHAYLVQMGIDQAAMPIAQYKEMKRTFIHACGKMLTLLIGPLRELSEKEGGAAIYDMINQVDRFTFQEIADEYRTMADDVKELCHIANPYEPCLPC